MRKLVTHFLILLTAFQGMVGSVMAYGMMQEASEIIAINEYYKTASGQFDHKNSSEMPCHSAVDEDITAHAAGQCTACQICHLNAELTQPTLSVSLLLTSAPVVTFVESYTSADPLRIAEPPIL